MFILIFVLVISLSIYVSNKTLGIADDNEENSNYSAKDSLIIFGILLAGIVLQIISKFLADYFWWIALAYFIAALSIMIVFISTKKERIEAQRKEIQQIYDILQKMVDKKAVGLDFNNVPFKLGYKYKKINKIDVEVDPTSFDEKILAMILQQLNAFLNSFTWSYELHLEERYMSFIGNDKPPTVARWPGSWLHYFKYMPIGISGKGEIAFQPDSVPKGRMGHSMYKDDHGNYIPNDLSLPHAPQSLVCGATGGGKAIWTKQEIDK